MINTSKPLSSEGIGNIEVSNFNTQRAQTMKTKLQSQSVSPIRSSQNQNNSILVSNQEPLIQSQQKRGGRSNYTMMAPIMETSEMNSKWRKKTLSKNADNKHGPVQNLESMSQSALREAVEELASSRYDNSEKILAMDNDGSVSWTG